MDLNIIDNKSRLAIVVVGYNRIDSIKRILKSLDNAVYPCDVPLVISIDASGCQPLYDYVNTFTWNHGNKYVIIRENRMGLRDHIISCGDLTEYFRGVIILEDDIFVSPYFYYFALACVDKYDLDDRVSGISLYRPAMDGNLPIDYVQDGKDTFAYQNVESWGECWTERMWNQFREWYNDTPDHDFSNVDMPEHMKNWKKAWSKYYMAFQIETGRFFIYPSVSYTTCFSEAGEHGKTSSIGQVVLQSECKEYNLQEFDTLSKYDIYGNNLQLFECLKMSPLDLCIDMYGHRDNIHNCRYILSPYTYPYKVIKEYALSLRPIELNVLYDVEGNGLFLYDTEGRTEGRRAPQAPLSLIYYHIRQISIHALYRYVISYTKDNIGSTIRKKFHLF